MAERYGRNKRRINCLLQHGASVNDLRKLFIREGLTARHFNSLWLDLEGERKSRTASVKIEIADKKRRIAALEKRLKKPQKKGGYAPFEAHHKKRRLARLRATVERLQKEPPHLVFGGHRLWKSQHYLEENGYTDHEEWLKDWRKCRSSEFFLVGSKDQSFGNQSSQWNPVTKTLRVRLPNDLGGPVLIPEVHFPQGEELLVDAILRRNAVTYHFLRKKKGWYILATVKPPVVEVITDLTRGAIGIDVGPSLVAAVETDAAGNPISRKTFRLALYGKTQRQAATLIEEVAVEIGDWAKGTGKPVSVERLDFSVRKAELKERGKRYARILSGFAYGKILSAIRSRCAKKGVGVIQVNAAFSSLIGIVKFSAMYGLSEDEAAALALARRAMNLGESVPTRTAFRRPEDRRKHVWSLWNRFGKAQRPGWRHAFIAARRGPGGSRGYPSAFPARAAPS
jgi:IS605 OrfB family transposase